MTLNMGTLDRRLRGFVAAPILIVIALVAGLGSAAGLVLLALGAVMLVTALVGSCPLYSLFHLTTRRGTRPLAH